MSTKNKLLAFLEEDRQCFRSGEEIAARLGISRAAVWKAVNALRTAGLEVDSVPGQGYRLTPGGDWLSEEALRALLPKDAPPLRVLQQLDSTNLEAKRWAIEGAPHGAMVAAVSQTAGRGRLGRSFASPTGGLYLSMVLRPPAQMPPADVVLMTPAAAVVVCRAVAQLCGIQLGIKWVNDLYIGSPGGANDKKGGKDGESSPGGQKKCCGILTEASTSFESGAIEYMVTGIGINLTTPPGAFPEETREIAGSLYPQGKAPVSRAQLAAAIHQGLLRAFATLQSRNFLQEYKDRSIVLGRQVTVMAAQPYPAQAVDIDEEARLVVRLENGTLQPLSHGEISVRL